MDQLTLISDFQQEMSAPLPVGVPNPSGSVYG
jgi:hypothetical protein